MEKTLEKVTLAVVGVPGESFAAAEAVGETEPQTGKEGKKSEKETPGTEGAVRSFASPLGLETAVETKTESGSRTLVTKDGKKLPRRRIVILSSQEATATYDRKENFRAIEGLSAFYGKNKIEFRDGEKTYMPFSRLQPSTLTVLGKLTRSLDLRSIFYKLPITDVNFVKKKTKKVKINVMGPPGAILSARYIDDRKKITRGIDKGTRYFLNCITMDLSLKDKNISFKLFSSTIQLTGCKALAHAEEAAAHVIKHIKDIEAQGVDVYADEEEEETGEETKEALPELAVTDLDIKMQNYDFNLGFKVDRKALSSLINKRNGFLSSYEPGVTNGVSVKVLLPVEKHEIEYTASGNPKRKKPKTISLIVFASGSTIMSGAKTHQMKHWYNVFRDTINTLEEQIKEKAED